MEIQFTKYDRHFLSQYADGIPREAKAELWREYRSEWIRGAELEIVPWKQQNAGRRRANIWLRRQFRIRKEVMG